MDLDELVAGAVVLTVLFISFLSGPLVPGVDFTPTPADDGPAPQTGNATVDVVSVPETARLEKGAFKSNASYALVVPDATVRLSGVTGRPLLVYKIRIPELGYSRGTTHFLESPMRGRRSVELEQATLEGEFSQDAYRGELLLLLRGDGPERTLYRGNVTVEVTR